MASTIGFTHSIEVRERRPPARRSTGSRRLRKKVRRTANEFAEQIRELREQVDDELERLADELREVQVVEVERREVRELVGAAVERGAASRAA
jgi:hypothetical protein